MAFEPDPDKPSDPSPSELDQARTEIERLRRENEELRQRLGPIFADAATSYQHQAPELPLEINPLPAVTNASSVQEKIGLFRSLFRGREDVYAVRWTSERTGKSGYSPACEEPPFVLNGGQGKKERTAIIKAIQETPQDQDLIVVATGQYLGEGFDCPQLNTLFMAFPIAFKGNLVQYAGRILRTFPGKTDAEVYDYVDVQTPVLKNMFFRRQKAYKSLGFESSAALG